jgi:formamidopyrimidine-DNA glycosylase
MPEVVEIKLTSLFLHNELKNKKIKKITVDSGRYKRHGLANLEKFNSKMSLKIKNVKSKGKFMWFELEDNNNKKYYILNTYGLEGSWGFNKLKHSNVSFELSNKKTLYFTDSRNFGTLVLTYDKKDLDKKLDAIGPDLLQEEFTNSEFYDRINDYLFAKEKLNTRRKNKKIVQILMDQTSKTGLGSGIGNYLVAEILFRAKLSPHSSIYEIYQDRKKVNSLSAAIRYELKLAFMTSNVGYLGHLSDEMDEYVTTLRKNITKKKFHMYNFHSPTKLKKEVFAFKIYRQKKDPLGNTIKGEKDIIKGRTTYWSPTVQK